MKKIITLFLLSIVLTGCPLPHDCTPENCMIVVRTDSKLDYSKYYVVLVDEVSGEVRACPKTSFTKGLTPLAEGYYMTYMCDFYDRVRFLTITFNEMSVAEVDALENKEKYLMEGVPFLEVYVDEEYKYGLGDSLYLKKMIESGALSTIMTREK